MKQVNLSNNLKYSFIKDALGNELVDTMEQSTAVVTEAKANSIGSELVKLVNEWKDAASKNGKKLVLGGKAALDGLFSVGKTYQGNINITTLSAEKLLRNAYGSETDINVVVPLKVTDDSKTLVDCRFKVNEKFFADLSKISESTPLTFQVREYNDNKFLYYVKMN